MNKSIAKVSEKKIFVKKTCSEIYFKVFPVFLTVFFPP